MRSDQMKPQGRFLQKILLLLFFGYVSLPFIPIDWAGPASAGSLNGHPRMETASQGELLTPETVVNRRKIRDIQLSPDEKHIAMVIVEPTKGASPNSNIWVYDVATKKSRRLTTSQKSDNHPRWSPDGSAVAFLSNRSGRNKIYILPFGGGEAEALAKKHTGVPAFAWSPDGSKIAFVSRDPKTEVEKQKEKDRDDPVVWDQNIKAPRLRVIDISSREVQTLTEEALRVSQLVWLPQGDKVLIAATDHPNRDYYTDRLSLVDIATKEKEEIETPPGMYQQMRISPDGRRLAYVASRPPEFGPIVIDLFLRPLKGGETLNLTAGSIDRQVKSFVWEKDGSFTVMAKTGFTTSFFAVTPDGKAKKWNAFPVNPLDFFVIAEEFTAFVGDTSTQASELWVSSGPDQVEKVTAFNKHWDGIFLAEAEVFQYPSFDGWQIEAALLKPRDYKPGIRFPLVTIIHGGPTARFADRFLYRLSSVWAQLLVAQGYAVFTPNIRGSTGYGLDFAASCRYDWGGGDWKDIMAGIDYLIEQGIADPDRLGIGGWSYGGYMGAWAVTQTNRFKVSVAGSPMTDMAVEYGRENHSTNIYDDWFLGNPYENEDLFNRMSPLFFVKKAKTPILLLMGENDPINPIAQVYMFYRGLVRFGVETEFVFYPREPHGLREEKHIQDMLSRMLTWFNRYLK